MFFGGKSLFGSGEYPKLHEHQGFVKCLKGVEDQVGIIGLNVMPGK